MNNINNLSFGRVILKGDSYKTLLKNGSKSVEIAELRRCRIKNSDSSMYKKKDGKYYLSVPKYLREKYKFKPICLGKRPTANSSISMIETINYYL